MRRLSKLAFFGAVFSLAAGLPGPVLARSVPATGGRANPPTEASCFQPSFGTVSNVCATTKTLEFPLVMDWAGSFTGTVYAMGASSSNNVGCQANGMTNGLGGSWITWWFDAYRYLPAFGTYQAIATTAYSPPNGSAYVTCNVDPGARLSVTEW